MEPHALYTSTKFEVVQHFI